jgi:hypothetical protein
MPKRRRVLYETTIRTVDKHGKGMEEFEKGTATVRGTSDRAVVYVPEVDVRVVDVRLLRLSNDSPTSYTLNVIASDDPTAAPSASNRIIAELTSPPTSGTVMYATLTNNALKVPAGTPIIVVLSSDNSASLVGVEVTAIPYLGDVTY